MLKEYVLYWYSSGDRCYALWTLNISFKFLANPSEDDLCTTLLVICFHSLANPIQDKYLFHKPSIMSHRTINRSYTRDNSVKSG